MMHAGATLPRFHRYNFLDSLVVGTPKNNNTGHV